MRDVAARRFALIVFDWDGTLVDSTMLIARALQQACRDLGSASPGRCRRALRDRARDWPTRCKSVAPDAAAASISGARRALPPPLPRARGRYSAVRRRARVVGRNSTRRAICWRSRPARPGRASTRALERNATQGAFHATRCADEGFPKPHPDMLLHLMDAAGRRAARNADDRRHDARSRAGAECRCVAVWRWHMARTPPRTWPSARRSRPCIRLRNCGRGLRATPDTRAERRRAVQGAE